MDVKIADGFGISNCVGLYGMSGMGKSHLAYHYVVRFRDTDSIAHRKHTFWVEAGTEARFRETVRRIAEDVQLELSSNEDLFASVKHWLSESSNGPWIVVIDGLDNIATATALKRVIPRDSGQILITTGNRKILDSLDDFLPPRERRRICLQVGRLVVSESRLVFQWHNDDVLPKNSEMDDLLSKFSSPVLIKLMAKYSSNNNIPTSKLYELMMGDKFQERLYNDLTKDHRIFEPLSTSISLPSALSAGFSEWPSVELKLLGELSCLNKDEIDIRLIQQNYENQARLLEMMGLIENCSYVGKAMNDKDQCYFMHETVQTYVHRWVRTNLGLVALLDLYATALYMLITLYNDDKKDKKDAKKICRSSYLWKLRYMAHFDRFLDFARAHTTKIDHLSKFECHDRMVQSVITFSQVYLDEGRYDDAVCVLDFTRKLYKGIKFRPHLVRHLSKAYILPPLSRLHRERWIEATRMLEEVIHECASLGDTLQRWECILDLAKLYNKSSRPKYSSMVLKCLRGVSLETIRGEIKLVRSGKRLFEDKDEWKMAVLKKVEEDRAHVAWANCSKVSKIQNKELNKAHREYSIALSAISLWSPEEERWLLEVEEGIAKVLCKMEDADSIKKSISIFERILHRSKEDFQAPDRAWGQKKYGTLNARLPAHDCNWAQTGSNRLSEH